MKEDYRKNYKDFYKINYGDNYEIHHIDFNRENNNINNLVLLPKELHKQYHKLINGLCEYQNARKDGMVDLKLSNPLVTDFSINLLKDIYECISKCKKWIEWKKCNYDQNIKRVIFKEEIHL